MKVSIVIPVYNERAFIEQEVLLRVLASPIGKRGAVVIDDRSTDGTCQLLAKISTMPMSDGKREAYGAKRQGGHLPCLGTSPFLVPVLKE